MSVIPITVHAVRYHSKRIFSLRYSSARGSLADFPVSISSAVPPERGHHLGYLSQYQKRLFSSNPSLSPDDAKTLILSIIGENKVTIFSKTYCPFCDKAKKLFRTFGEDAKILELDLRPDGAIIQDELAKMTGQRSVPNVFVKGQHAGGNDDCQAMARSGKLHEMLKE
jgi:glutaredoxin 3